VCIVFFSIKPASVSIQHFEVPTLQAFPNFERFSNSSSSNSRAAEAAAAASAVAAATAATYIYIYIYIYVYINYICLRWGVLRRQ
jgi:hypothetical protein